ncbi:hypothetical protein RMDY18_19870 [Rothia mucilaginosa DY-18]|uniref:Uncharacterized protein n=1 Tax=Rothia mucilaginosa (strain DY-18) TaxID=680646 RepID=D2NQA1_ROTMD|nr:hypothetical protein RMDY18_19870 [Rothia mucilaginosa DY-18]
MRATIEVSILGSYLGKRNHHVTARALTLRFAVQASSSHHIVHDLTLVRAQRLHVLIATGSAHLLNRVSSDLLQLLTTLSTVASDVQNQAGTGAVTSQDGEAHQLLQSLQNLTVAANQVAQFLIVVIVINDRQVDAVIAHLNINVAVHIDNIEEFFEVVSGDIAFLVDVLKIVFFALKGLLYQLLLNELLVLIFHSFSHNNPRGVRRGVLGVKSISYTAPGPRHTWREPGPNHGRKLLLSVLLIALLLLALLTHRLLALTGCGTLTRLLQVLLVLLAGLTHRGQALRRTAGVQLTLGLGTGGRVVADNPPLLTQRPEVRDGPVVQHTKGEVDTGNSEDDREDVHNHLLLTEHRGVQSSLRHVLHAQLLLDVELGGAHQNNHDDRLNNGRGGVASPRVHHGREELSTENLRVVELMH